MSGQTPETHFLKLLDDLPRIRQAVDTLESSNIGDDRAVKFAIAGYSHHRPVESWGRDEAQFVASRRSEVLDFGLRWVEFVCLATGYMLGLFRSGLLSDQECDRFEALLPGFMWLHSKQFTQDES
jgi:hypothetical protein